MNNLKDFDVNELEQDIVELSDDEKELYETLEVSRKFRTNIFEKRRELNLDVKGLANKANVKVFEVNAIEKGKLISVLSLIKILRALDLDINKIFE